MADLTFIERNQLEKLLEMDGGYVLDFSNRTFQELIVDSVGKDIDDERYHFRSSSKANRLRAFWKKEPNYIVGKLTNDLAQYAETLDSNGGKSKLLTECRRIAHRLLQGAPVPEIDAITPNADGRGFETLAKSVRASIDDNEPESGLDRLHTFVVKYVRVICSKHGISTSRDKPLHSMFGEYVKYLRNGGRLESKMTERILKSSISTLEEFNHVRNNQSFAHDNELLNYHESLLIFNHVAASIRFLQWIENPDDFDEMEESEAEVADEIPF